MATVFVTRGGRLGGFLHCTKCGYRQEGVFSTLEELRAHLEAQPVWDGSFKYKVGVELSWEVNGKWVGARIVAAVAPFHSAKEALENAGVTVEGKLSFMDRSARARYLLECGDIHDANGLIKKTLRAPVKSRFENAMDEMEGC